MSKKIPPEFVVSIAIRNEAGDVLERREFITYQGLLAMAHDQGLHEIATELLQAPSAANGRFAIVRASVKGKPVTFVGLGDASPENTSRRVVRHLVRVAETRAKARALRDLTNVGMVALEELGGTEEGEPFEPAPAPHGAAVDARKSGAPATEAQRRALLARARALGHPQSTAAALLRSKLGCEVARAGREQASRLLAELDRELARRRASPRAAAE